MSKFKWFLSFFAVATTVVFFQNCGSSGVNENVLQSLEKNELETERVFSAATAGMVMEDTNVSGGGFQSDVTINESGNIVYSAGDVSGVNKSVNGGRVFYGFNHGLRSLKVASIAITPGSDHCVYAGTGNQGGGSGGLFRSTNGGATWTLPSKGGLASFSGNHSHKDDPVVQGHARSNGDLIAVYPAGSANSCLDDIVIAGTYKSGVRIFTQSGDRQASVVKNDGFVRSVAVHPSRKLAYAAIQFKTNPNGRNGIYRIDFTNASSPRVTLAYRTYRPEGLTVLRNGHVYAAIGKQGVVRFNGSNWQKVNQQSGSEDQRMITGNDNRQWTAVTGYVVRGKDVVYAGVTNMGGGVSKYSTIWRTEDSGANWDPLVESVGNSSNISDRIYGQGARKWWFQVEAFKQAALGLKNSVVSSIDVARGPDVNSVNDDKIFVSGCGGIWRSGNGGRSWSPAVGNLQVTANNDIAVNPKAPNQIVAANTDFVVLETRTRFTGNDEVILGAGKRDNNRDPAVYVKSAGRIGNPSNNGWNDLELAAEFRPNKGRVRAVGVGYHNGSRKTGRVILAAVEGQGVYRYSGGNWSRSSGVEIKSTKRSQFIWPNNENSGVVYLLDLSAGLYRSTNGGARWVNMWPGLKLNNNNFLNIGYIAASDRQPKTIYLSVQLELNPALKGAFKVYRIKNADSGIIQSFNDSDVTDLTKVAANSSIRRPGPMVVGPNGNLFLTQNQDSSKSVSGGLFRLRNPNTRLAFDDLTTTKYRQRVPFPTGIDVSTDGYAYISQVGLGIVKIDLP